MYNTYPNSKKHTDTKILICRINMQETDIALKNILNINGYVSKMETKITIYIKENWYNLKDYTKLIKTFKCNKID